ncbi:glycosyltransferase [Knoellia sp. GCM10027112]|uniref:glycosyltransferase n=1 Tax=Knoellia sp. GCM10027112 TaxID=3273395 RepID=UPI00360A7AF7
MTPPLIAHVSTAHPWTDNRIFRKECRALADAGFDVVLVAVADGDSRQGSVSVAAIRERTGRLRRFLLGPLDAWRRLSYLRPDLIHLHDPELIPLGLLWRLTHRGSRVVFDAHEDLPKQIAGKPYIPKPLRPLLATAARRLDEVADRFLDGIVAATPAIARNFTASKTVVVQNFPWLSDYPEPLPISDATPRRACYVGALSLARGYDEMVKVATDPYGEISLVLAGPASNEVRHAISQLTSSNITYEGIVSPARIPDLLRDSYVGLALLHPLPNYLESQATKIFEYMAAGRPFIASNFPAWERMLGPYECGIFVDPEDVAEITRQVHLLLADPDEARRMGDRGRAALADHFTFEHEATVLVARVRELTHHVPVH